MANNENTAVIDNQNEDSWSDIDESLLVQCDDNGMWLRHNVLDLFDYACLEKG